MYTYMYFTWQQRKLFNDSCVSRLIKTLHQKKNYVKIEVTNFPSNCCQYKWRRNIFGWFFLYQFKCACPFLPIVLINIRVSLFSTFLYSTFKGGWGGYIGTRKDLKTGNFTTASKVYMKYIHTAVVLRKNSLLHKQIKNHATLAYKNRVRKCFQKLFFITNMQFNNLTSKPQT